MRKVLLLMLVFLLVVSIVPVQAGTYSSRDVNIMEKPWWQRILDFDISGKTSVTVGTTETFYEIYDSDLAKVCSVQPTQFAFSVTGAGGVSFRTVADLNKCCVVGAEYGTFAYSPPNVGSYSITAQVYCQKKAGGVGWVDDPQGTFSFVAKAAGSTCTASSQCPSTGWTGASYCMNGNIYKTYRTGYCNNGACALQDDQRLLTNCQDSGLKCIPTPSVSCVASNYCTGQSDCSQPYYSGSNVCSGNSVVRNRVTEACTGSAMPRCIGTTTQETVQACGGQVCSGGACVTPTPVVVETTPTTTTPTTTETTETEPVSTPAAPSSPGVTVTVPVTQVAAKCTGSFLQCLIPDENMQIGVALVAALVIIGGAAFVVSSGIVGGKGKGRKR